MPLKLVATTERRNGHGAVWVDPDPEEPSHAYWRSLGYVPEDELRGVEADGAEEKPRRRTRRRSG